jgi:hypothetical protein
VDCSRVLLGLSLALCLGARSGAWADGPGRYRWEADDDAHGLHVFTSEVTEHGYDAVKVMGTLPLALAPLLAALQDFPAYPRWYHHAAAVRELSHPSTPPSLQVLPDGRIGALQSSGPWLLLFVQHTPPLTDRWAILQCVMRPGPQGSVRFEFHSQPTHPELAPRDAVRMQLRGFWQLTPLDRARTAVTFVLDVDPNTGAPAFLVDPVVRETAVETLRGLQRVAARHARSL